MLSLRLGGEPVLSDEWGIDICVSAGNKCLGAPPGAALFGVNPRVWEIAEKKEKQSASWYLNLLTWRRYRQEGMNFHPTPTTVHPRLFSALNVALRQLEECGIEKQWARYRENAGIFRQKMKQLGFSFLPKAEEASSVISVVERLPEMDLTDFMSYLASQHQIRVGGCFGELRGRMFRVGHLNLAGSPAYMQAFFLATEQYISKVMST